MVNYFKKMAAALMNGMIRAILLPPIQLIKSSKSPIKTIFSIPSQIRGCPTIHNRSRCIPLFM